MSKADGWRGKRSHFRFTSHKLRWSGSPYVHYYFIFFVFFLPQLFSWISLALQYWLTKKVICEARLFTAHCSWQTGDRVIGHNFGKCKSRRDSLNDRSGFGRCPRKKSYDLEGKNKWFRGWSADEQLYLLQEDWWVPFLIRGKLRILTN